MRVCAFTTISHATLPQARLLAETLRQAHPGWTLWAAAAGDPGAWFSRDEIAGFDAMLTAEDLGRTDYREGPEIGAALLHLLALGADIAVYLAPSMAVFHPLASLSDQYRGDSVVLTPNAGEAADQFDPAFLAVRGDADGRAFAQWWAGRLRAEANPAPRLPEHLNRVTFAFEPGWNVAAWNLPDRHLRFTPQGGITADGEPLCFCQFDLTRRPAQPEAAELWDWYARRIAEPR